MTRSARQSKLPKPRKPQEPPQHRPRHRNLIYVLSGVLCLSARSRSAVVNYASIAKHSARKTPNWYNSHMTIKKEAILAALSKVQEPELHKDLVTLNMIREL